MNSIRTIDQMGEFIDDHAPPVRTSDVRRRRRSIRGRGDRAAAAAAILPYLRGVVSSNRRTIAHWDSSDDALAFAESQWAEELCALGTSCPDHFLRTRICPMFVPWDPLERGARCARRADRRARVSDYREGYSRLLRVVR